LSGFWSALFGAILVSIFSGLASNFIGSSGRYNVLIVRRD
jgi:putative membrane protein